jgi:hypothetical protein
MKTKKLGFDPENPDESWWVTTGGCLAFSVLVWLSLLLL